MPYLLEDGVTEYLLEDGTGVYLLEEDVVSTLGYSTEGASVFSALAGRKIHTKFTLASAGTLNELHARVTGVGGGGGSGANNITISIYADVAGVPDALLATTASIPVVSSVNSQHLAQVGFSVALAAADYWVGVAFEQNHGALYYDAGGTYVGISSGAAWNPPANPYGTPDLGDAIHKFSVWGVVSVSAGGGVGSLSNSLVRRRRRMRQGGRTW